MARATRSAMPVAAEPAPRNTRRWSRRGLTGDAHGGVEAGERNRGRALDVVVEGAGAIAVARQEVDGVVGRKVLELQHRRREHLGDRGDELLHQRIVLRTAKAVLRQPDIERVVAELGILGARRRA